MEMVWMWVKRFCDYRVFVVAWVVRRRDVSLRTCAVLLGIHLESCLRVFFSLPEALVSWTECFQTGSAVLSSCTREEGACVVGLVMVVWRRCVELKKDFNDDRKEQWTYSLCSTIRNDRPDLTESRSVNGLKLSEELGTQTECYTP